MAPMVEQAAGPAWEGADLERRIVGEDPETDSLQEARRWVLVYSHLVKLEEAMLDGLASMIPRMPAAAKQEAERLNVPMLAALCERFRYRLAYWVRHKDELELR